MIVIIGGTSGIGLETAKYLKSLGKKVTVCGRHKIKEDLDYKYVDVRDENSIEELFYSLKHIDALVYSAGITKKSKSIELFDKATWENIIDVNVTGVLLSLKYAYNALRLAKGKIVIVNSLASRTYSLFSGVEYTMSKSALNGLVKQLGIEFAIDDVLINSVFPSMTETPMLIQNVPKEKLNDIKNNIPLKRLATPIEVAKAITFLISEDNTYMTGCGIDLNGGQFLNG